MTHILKARLFECYDMRHHHEAPQMQRDTSRVNESPRFGGFVSPVHQHSPPPPQPLLDQERKEQVRVERAELCGRKRGSEKL